MFFFFSLSVLKHAFSYICAHITNLFQQIIIIIKKSTVTLYTKFKIIISHILNWNNNLQEANNSKLLNNTLTIQSSLLIYHNSKPFFLIFPWTKNKTIPQANNQTKRKEFLTSYWRSDCGTHATAQSSNRPFPSQRRQCSHPCRHFSSNPNPNTTTTPGRLDFIDCLLRGNHNVTRKSRLEGRRGSMLNGSGSQLVCLTTKYLYFWYNYIYYYLNN